MAKDSCGCGCGAAACETGGAAAATGRVYVVHGLDCADCAAKLEKKIAALAGVRAAAVNFAAGKLRVEHDLADAAIIGAVAEAGYRAEADAGPGVAAGVGWRRDTRTRTIIAAGLLLSAAALAQWLTAPQAVQVALYALTMAVAGWTTARSGLYSLRSLSLDMNVLMTVAVVGAAAIGEWSEGATVAFLFAFGNGLQAYTLDKTRRSIRALMELAPSEATVVRGGAEVRLPVAAVEVGATVMVRPGERIGLDGVVLSGRSAVDESAITGESLPVAKEAGAAVYAGTVNGHGLLAVEVTKPAADSTLARIMHMVEEAQAQRAPSQQFVEVFARYYTPAVLAVAAAVMTLPHFVWQQPFAPWFYRGLVLLVISCPCALVISTPVSVVAAIGNASRQGVLIKGGACLERLGAIGAVAFDKTGTLTYGRPAVTDVLAFADLDAEELLELAAAVERWSEHPLARAVAARAAGRESRQVTGFEALVGRGAKAEVDGTTVYVGNARLFGELGLPPAPQAERLAALAAEGKTVMLVGTAAAVLGAVAVADGPRAESAAALGRLRTLGIRNIALLTGDNKRAAAAIAGGLAIGEVFGELLPADKVAAVRDLRRRHGGVAMVGDGVNDAPALAAADVGVAMGVAGSDAALETADVALMADDLGKLAYVVELGRKTVAVIKENIAFAVGVKAVFLALAIAGLADLWLAVFADMGASLLVTLNGMRLMRRLG